MDLWAVKSIFYSNRTLPFVSRILVREKQNLRELILAADPDKGLMLDVGTGLGHTLDVLPVSKETICLDASKSMLKKLRSRRDNRLLCADAVRLPFQHASFSFVSCIGVCEYVPDIYTLFQSLNRVLVSGGFLLITSAPDNFWSACRGLLGPSLFTMTSEEFIYTAGTSGLELLHDRRSMMQNQFLFCKP
ncbi:MAG: class I SAM-dependent methyltransferase [candidate division KSB1 bacterium]|nr:class I SAM-dependent methyltransferase [candidate division KSB1 bacterium]